MVRAGRWSEQELLRVLCAYASLSSAEKVKPPSGLIDEIRLHMPKRTKASIQMRFSNFVARDLDLKALGVKGLFGGGYHVDDIWQRFSTEDGSLSMQRLLEAAATQLGKEH